MIGIKKVCFDFDCPCNHYCICRKDDFFKLSLPCKIAGRQQRINLTEPQMIFSNEISKRSMNYV